jgi:hypothetical protein
VVKGFHKVMGTWWTEVEDRFTKKGMRAPYGLVTKIDSQVWTREDELKYGSFQPVPMEAGQYKLQWQKSFMVAPPSQLPIAD